MQVCAAEKACDGSEKAHADVVHIVVVASDVDHERRHALDRRRVRQRAGREGTNTVEFVDEVDDPLSNGVVVGHDERVDVERGVQICQSVGSE